MRLMVLVPYWTPALPTYASLNYKFGGLALYKIYKIKPTTGLKEDFSKYFLMQNLKKKESK